MFRSSFLFFLSAAVACPGLLSAATFPTTEQLAPLQEAAARAYPVPAALRVRLLDKLAHDVVAPLRSPLRRLWLNGAFTFDAPAFRQAFSEEWTNPAADPEARMEELNGRYEAPLRSLRQHQQTREASFMDELARMPGVTAQKNGVYWEALPNARAEENAPIFQADSIEVRDLRGDLHYAAPIGEEDLIDIADLPQCIAELAGKLPEAGIWVFIVPTAGLDKGACQNISPESGHLAFILRHASAPDDAPGAWGQLAARYEQNRAEDASESVSQAERVALSEYLGRALALFMKCDVPNAAPDAPFDALEELPNALLRHLNLAVTPRRPDDTSPGGDAEDAQQAYEAIMAARQTRIERELLRLHAAMPGVHVEKSGIQYAVEASPNPGDNRPFSHANRVSIARIGGKKLLEQPMRPTDIPAIAEMADRVPAGRSWTFFVPSNQTGDYQLLDDMEAGVALTFTIAGENETEDEGSSSLKEPSSSPAPLEEAREPSNR